MTSGYMTVGEVAELVGVTVRSIQYYDQQGILSPSAKGPQNQRFYTPDDVERLNCILSLKYAGLSLAQIRECLKDGRTVSRAQAYELFVSALRETESTFNSLLNRYATLRMLAETVAPAGSGATFQDADAAMFSAACEEPDWGALTNLLARSQNEDKYFWRLSGILSDAVPEAPCDDPDMGIPAKSRLATEWHGLIAATINHMNRDEALDSEQGQAIVRRFIELSAEDGRHPDGKSFLLLEGAPANHPGGASFGSMRQRVYDHLGKLVARFAELHPEERVPAFDGGGAA